MNFQGLATAPFAGEKGKALEKASSTLFAAMQIYKASSPVKVSPVRFFEPDAVALADMRRCAEEEAKLASAEAADKQP